MEPSCYFATLCRGSDTVTLRYGLPTFLSAGEGDKLSCCQWTVRQWRNDVTYDLRLHKRCTCLWDGKSVCGYYEIFVVMIVSYLSAWPFREPCRHCRFVCIGICRAGVFLLCSSIVPCWTELKFLSLFVLRLKPWFVMRNFDNVVSWPVRVQYVYVVLQQRCSEAKVFPCVQDWRPRRHILLIRIIGSAVAGVGFPVHSSKWSMLHGPRSRIVVIDLVIMVFCFVLPTARTEAVDVFVSGLLCGAGF